MKDARGHGSDGRGGGNRRLFTPNSSGVRSDVRAIGKFAAHQAGIMNVGPTPEGRDIFARLSAHAQAMNPNDHSGLSHQDITGITHG